MAKRYYLNIPDAEFDLWLENFISFVKSKAFPAGATPAAWTFIDADDFDEVKDAQTGWKTHYDAFLATPTKAKRQEKDDAKAAAKKIVGPFVQHNLYHKKITNGERVSAGVPVRDIIRTMHIVVTETVEFFFRLKNIREIEVHFKVSGSEGKGKPSGYKGAVIVWEVLDTPPVRPQELKHHALASKTPYLLTFDETQRGKTVYVALCWENNRANQGPWSEIHSAIVP